MQADLVATFGKLDHAFGVMQRIPPFDEERALETQFFQHVEHPRIAGFQPRLFVVGAAGGAVANFPGSSHVVEGQAQGTDAAGIPAWPDHFAFSRSGWKACWPKRISDSASR